ncbi:GNAT family N-acetyltransferase [Hyphobacterium marinum]|uniref:GNAT family N-acetyltransferase n=1 Tax=Hyphobacterium marinum TaxID=3116574 RepID=A0ABU7LVG5_9PROT|nr:GNAT family N-acetyltransferase [Hyphobacterium sp. Y6023]MEE2565165.1 GNAT family N-acetyltransferase [Hyphobacterium sp. Y6023]
MAEPRKLDWDSDFFGFTVVEAHSTRSGEGDLDRVVGAACQMGATLLVYTVPAGSPVSLPGRAAHVDVRHTYICDYSRITFGPPEAAHLIEFHEGRDPLPELDRLALLSGQHSRFFNDPLFPRPAAEALYTTWMRRALTREFGDHVLVARDPDGVIAAMYSGRIDSAGFGVPDLMAVDPRLRGRALGAGFLQTSMLHYRERGIVKGRLRSQGRNRFARAIYERLGWTLAACEDVYHVWLGVPPVKEYSS